MDDDLDSDERGAWESEEESEEEREELGVFTSHQESDGREEGRGWEEEVYGAAQWEERELQAQLD